MFTMIMNELTMFAIFLIGAASLYCFCKTKKPGFGRFTTGTLLVIMVVTISALLYAGGKLTDQAMTNILFAVAGFAGGLFTNKESS